MEEIAKPVVWLIAVALLLFPIIPLPMLLLDILIAANLLFSLAIIIAMPCRKKTFDFAFLPFVLPVYTIFGLALNIAATRLILTRGRLLTGG